MPLNKRSRAGMVDISSKDVTVRRAVAQGVITLSPAAFKALITGRSPKGDVLETARIAGIMAAKSTPALIPLCHPLVLEKIKVECLPQKSKHAVLVTAEVLCSGKTGVEMEALAAVSVACLTIYDMMKWAGQDMVISGIRLMHKSGGKSGNFDRGKT
ncbi:MAG: cyclic pyranopterin monophosphate synthase MoaC [Candidatus Omnitrophota bacterium]|nr:cyclic pyranopterin monophosphate synthase MoaC [Candidatus Omnitrophota bacterium]